MSGRKVNFEKPNYEVSRFAAVCAIGRSVRRHLRDLFQATHFKTKLNWSELIDKLSILINDVFPAAGSSRSPSGQIGIGKAVVKALAETYAEKNPELQAVLIQLEKGIEPFLPGELAAHLEDLYKGSADFGRNCIRMWGGARARELLARPMTTRLVFLSEEAHPTFAYTDKADDNRSATVTLVIGNGKDILKSYLSLEAYFFHEYVSHVFPRWDDLAGRFSEGYLFALERKFFQVNSHVLKNGFSLHSKIVASDLEEHRRRTGKQSSSHSDVEGLYVWVESHCTPGVFDGILLELCAINSRGGVFEEKFLNIVDIVADRQDPELARLLSKAGKDPRIAFENVSSMIGRPSL